MYSELSNRWTVATVNQPGTAHPGRAQATVQSTKTNFAALDRRIQVVVMLLESKSHKQIAIEDMARFVNLSPGRLAHLFKSEMELSIQQYLTQLRLAKAKSKLESSFLSIKEIAASVGFSSVARFVVCFKNYVGVTPSHYRKHFLNLSFRDADALP
ncbi:MAG TPA: AraC family transcriptional regulator [Pyrinomonadaceae bacterium]|jgi:transcriptional regulator GlxA family with amidase domain|nr:AraC family transcriptional regulator [Pyrinomonadaceae bacterium]